MRGGERKQAENKREAKAKVDTLHSKLKSEAKAGGNDAADDECCRRQRSQRRQRRQMNCCQNNPSSKREKREECVSECDCECERAHGDKGRVALFVKLPKDIDENMQPASA